MAGDNGCFPPWLKRRSTQVYGPNFEDPIPYPVYQNPPTVFDVNNSNQSRQVVGDSYYQWAAGTVAIANLDTTIIEVMPQGAYDTINIVCFPFPVTAAGPPRLPGQAVPVFFSMDEPRGRLNINAPSKVPLNGSQEAFVLTASVFAPATDFSSYPTCIRTPDVYPNITLNAEAGPYTNFLYPTVKTNRPFYFWFGDGINTLPPAPVTNVGFKVTWYVQGR